MKLLIYWLLLFLSAGLLWAGVVLLVHGLLIGVPVIMASGLTFNQAAHLGASND